MELNGIYGIERIRFLTSHPNDMSVKLIDAVASLDKVCEHINLPVQAGDDGVLESMHRGYNIAQYLRLVETIRGTVPNVALTTDLIVGFPGETDAQFQRSVELIREVRFEKIHVAAYSQRPGTIAARTANDDVPLAEKRRRVKVVEQVQEAIAKEINEDCVGTLQEVMIEKTKGDKWEGRTRTNKLVYLGLNSGKGAKGKMETGMVALEGQGGSLPTNGNPFNQG